VITLVSVKIHTLVCVEIKLVFVEIKLVCENQTLRVESHSAGEICTLRVEITLVRVKITLVHVKRRQTFVWGLPDGIHPGSQKNNRTQFKFRNP
jgi:hypothetical protein